MNYAAPVNDSEHNTAPGDTYTGHKCRLRPPFRSNTQPTAGRAGNLGEHSDRKLIVAANAGQAGH